ncbi:MAG: transcriptional regulator [Alphaproteobacteria bacterium]|nr:transcriptional regulator [Alphaproteobacteria bacterium]
MTPFGEKLRSLRQERGVTLKQMAEALQLSSPYLSALEHGRKGRPTKVLLHQICGYFNIIWDEAEDLIRLAEISHPKITIDTSGLSSDATLLANLLSEKIKDMNPAQIEAMLSIVTDKKRDN